MENFSAEEKYAKALLFRDNKVEGFSKEQSTTEAEQLFLQLGEKGNSKAMHNYAVIQQKKGKYRYAEECYKQAGLEASLNNIKSMREQGVIKEDLFLVIGSTRGGIGNHGSPIMDEVYGTKGIDLSHLKSFHGKATTSFLTPSTLSQML